MNMVTSIPGNKTAEDVSTCSMSKHDKTVCQQISQTWGGGGGIIIVCKANDTSFTKVFP